MLNSLYYGLALIAVLLIGYWYIQNDGEGQNDGTSGFLAMTKSKPPPKPKQEKYPGKRSFRRKP